MPDTVDVTVAGNLNTRAAASVMDFGAAFTRGLVRQVDGADELTRQTFVGLVADNRLITALNAREIVMAADPGTQADISAQMALKAAPPYWPQAAPPGAPGGSGGASAGGSGAAGTAAVPGK